MKKYWPSLLVNVTIKKHNLKRRVEKKYQKGENFPKNFDDDDEVFELGCTARQAYNWLRKSWIKLRICRSKSDEIGIDETQEQINRIQNALGLDITDWEAYEG